MFKSILENLQKKTPLVHCITNYVTVNDVANILLACGGSPIMADDEGEVEEITSLCNSLVINIGTLNQRTVHSMLLAGKKANSLSHPVILDPVGAGASNLRTSTSFQLLKNIQFAVIRGNISEIKTLYEGMGSTHGVDANIDDVVTEENLSEAIDFAKKLSIRTNAVIAITGAIDIVANQRAAYVIRNGHPMMSKITGSGCMLTAMIGAFVGANPTDPFPATAAAVCAMGIAGQQSVSLMEKEKRGTSSLRTFLIDHVHLMTEQTLSSLGKVTQLTNVTKNMLRLYAVTDHTWLGEQTFQEQISLALKGGTTFVQLREKEIDLPLFIQLGKEIKELTSKYNVPFVINDNVVVALACEADGVHVGQRDMIAKDVRKLIGPNKILGVSAQTVEQAVLAEEHGADYIGVGAIFPTSTKTNAAEVSYETLKDICQAVTIPVIAIGGITTENIPQLQGSSIDGVAVVSGIFAAKDIKKATEQLRQSVDHLLQL